MGGGLWGVLGMFIGVPLFACLYTFTRKFCAWRLAEKGLPIHSHNYRFHKPVTDEVIDAQREAANAEKEAAKKEKKK